MWAEQRLRRVSRTQRRRRFMSGRRHARNWSADAAQCPARVLLRTIQVRQDFIACGRFALHGNRRAKAMVLPQAVLFGLLHLCENLVARLARLRVFGVRRVNQNCKRRVNLADLKKKASDRSKRQGRKEGANCHVSISLGLNKRAPETAPTFWPADESHVTVC